MGETFLKKLEKKIPNLSSDLGTSTGLSDVYWTRTTVGGPNYLGGSVTIYIIPKSVDHGTIYKIRRGYSTNSWIYLH
jgi:hypothetical protein